MKIFVVTDTKFPNNDAVTARTSHICKIFKENGYDVRVFSRTELHDGIYENIPYFSLRGTRSGKFGKAFDYFFEFSRRFINIAKKERPDVIVFYNIPTRLLKKLIKLKSNLGYDLINDCVEWYSKEQVAPSIASRIQYYTKDRWIKNILPGNVRIIAISRYLKEHFESVNTPCEYLPAVCDTQKVSFCKNTNESQTTIVYAGSPGRKDLFAPIIYAIKKLTPEERQRLNIEIIGSTPEKISDNANCSVKVLESMRDCLHFLPRMSHDEVLKHLETADFTILIRPEHLRYAKAGFPTKVPESLSTGTPVICNLTSDLEMYLEDGINAIIAKGPDNESVLFALKKALSLTPDKRNQMYFNARKTAEEKFDYRIYKAKIFSFLLPSDKQKDTQC